MIPGPNSIKIFKQGEEILTQPSAPIKENEFNSPELIELAEKLKSIQAEIGAVGFSAPQIGSSKRLMIIGMQFDNPRRPNVKQFPNMLFINPEITYSSVEQDDDWEGCASVDKTIALVDRSIHISYKARDVYGNQLNGELSNFPARVFQHELDHLDGVLMTDKAKEVKEVDPSIKIISLKP
ncbi:MAG: peptide deformylase [Gammaproteobacteria bacterium]